MKKRKILYILSLIILGSVILSACKKNENKGQDTSEVISEIPTPTPTIGLEPTKVPPTVTPTPITEDNQVEEKDYISQAQAIKNIQAIIGEKGYYFELLNSDVTIENNVYYDFRISDSGSAIKPDVLVDKVSGELLCYYEDGSTKDFSEYPLYTSKEEDNTDTQPTNDTFSKEDALNQLSKLSPEKLGLTKELSTYTIKYDDWTTNVKGVECYGINAFSGSGDDLIYEGAYYVAVDGSKMFYFDSLLDNIVELK